MKLNPGAPFDLGAISVRASMLLVAAGVFLFAAGSFLRSVPSAKALPEGPQVTGGSHPYLSFTGLVSVGAPVVVYTVPADRIFVLTGACTNASIVDLLEDDSPKIDGSSQAMNCSTSNSGSVGFLGRGEGHVTFAPGSEVTIVSTSGTNPASYALQGYLARP